MPCSGGEIECIAMKLVESVKYSSLGIVEPLSNRDG